MRQTRAKLNWYKITWKWHRNTSIGDLLKDSSFGSHKGNVKIVIGNRSNSSSHGKGAKAACFYFASIKNNNFIKSCRRIILMARIWIKRRLSIQKKIHGCSENSVSEEALFTSLHGRYIFSLNVSAKPTFILRKSKGNSYSQEIGFYVPIIVRTSLFFAARFTLSSVFAFQIRTKVFGVIFSSVNWTLCVS